jgi:hypothetical protein
MSDAEVVVGSLDFYKVYKEKKRRKNEGAPH